MTITLGGAATLTTTTNANGYYSFTGLVNGAYTITPSKSGYSFNPSSRNPTVSGGDVPNQDFTATPVGSTYTISGTVTSGGAGLSGVTITLSGAATLSTTTNANGYYSFSGLANGQYTITPSKSGYSFNPSSRNPTVNGQDVPNQDFTATPTGIQIIRTMVAHEITHEVTQNTSGVHDAIYPKLSYSGNRAVYVVESWVDPRTMHVKVIDFDGSGQREADVFEGDWPGFYLDISADGSKVMSLSGAQGIRVVNADGSGLVSLIKMGGYPISRMSGDGQKVFIKIGLDTSTSTGFPMKRGIWVINTDGTGLQQVVGPDQVAALLGVSADTVGFEDAFDISYNGSRIVFAAEKNDQAGYGAYVLGINLDSSFLHQFPISQIRWARQLAISGDGSKVACNINLLPCCSSPSELWVVNWDNSGKKKLTDSTQPGLWSEERMTLSGDGSRLLFGSTSYLYDTTANPVTRIQLGVITGAWTTDPPLLVGDGLYLASMSSDAGRFVFLTKTGNDQGFRQLATYEINPADLGAAPGLSNMDVNPTSVTRDMRTTFSTFVTPKVAGDKITTVGAGELRDGAGLDYVYGVRLEDKGSGLFSSEWGPNSWTLLGPRTVRFKAEVYADGGAGRAHATMVEVVPFQIVDNLPGHTISGTVTSGGRLFRESRQSHRRATQSTTTRRQRELQIHRNPQRCVYDHSEQNRIYLHAFQHQRQCQRSGCDGAELYCAIRGRYTRVTVGNHQHHYAGLHLECRAWLHLVLPVCQ